MRKPKQNKDPKKSYTTGELNKIIDATLHPLSKDNKWMIVVDGVAHGLVEQNLPLSLRKFVEFNVPKLLEKPRSKTRLSGRKRRYRCELPATSRYLFCSHQKAGSWCLRSGPLRGKCAKLHISYQ